MEDKIKKTVEFVKENMQGDGSCHDWWHCYRVWQTSLKIAQVEKADLLVTQLAALLHDISDWKMSENNDETIGPKIAYDWSIKLGVPEEKAQHVKDIIETISFKGADVKTPMKTIEGKIVQDADRMDAIGAIGIARTFSYAGFIKRELYNPNIECKMHKSFEEYKKGGLTAINHFYEKMLLLKDRMNTNEAKKIAEKRHDFMCLYLDTFFEEWGNQSST